MCAGVGYMTKCFFFDRHKLFSIQFVLTALDFSQITLFLARCCLETTDCSSKCEPKKTLPIRFSFFSTFVTAALATLRISAYFFLKIGNFFESLQKNRFWRIFRAYFAIGRSYEKYTKNRLWALPFLVINMPFKGVSKIPNFIFY